MLFSRPVRRAMELRWVCVSAMPSPFQEGRNDSSAQCRGKINVSATYCYILPLYGTQANVSRGTQANVSRHKRMCPVNMYILNCCLECSPLGQCPCSVAVAPHRKLVAGKVHKGNSGWLTKYTLQPLGRFRKTPSESCSVELILF